MLAAPYQAEGWLPAETDGTWTRGARGTFGTQNLGPSEASILVNDRPILTIALNTDNMHASTCLLPAEVLAGRQDIAIDVVAGRAGSPFAVTESTDDRLLGVQIKSCNSARSSRLRSASRWT